MQDITLYIQKTCSKSSAAQEILKESGVPHRLINLSVDTPLPEQLRELARKADVPLLALARQKEPLFAELVSDENLSDEALAQLLSENPSLIERPIAVRGEKAIIARPPENIQSLLN